MHYNTREILVALATVSFLGAVASTTMNLAYAQGNRPFEPPGDQLTQNCPEGYSYDKSAKICYDEASYPNPICPDGYERNDAGDCQSTDTVTATCSSEEGYELVDGRCQKAATVDFSCPSDYPKKDLERNDCYRFLEFGPPCDEDDPPSTEFPGLCEQREYTDEHLCPSDNDADFTYNEDTHMCEGYFTATPTCDDGYELVSGTNDCQSTDTVDELPREPDCAGEGVFNTSTDRCETKPIKGNR
jgi:hypothetical protein